MSGVGPCVLLRRASTERHDVACAPDHVAAARPDRRPDTCQAYSTPFLRLRNDRAHLRIPQFRSLRPMIASTADTTQFIHTRTRQTPAAGGSTPS